MIEAVGHWSMLDVFVVVLLVGTIRFGPLGGVMPEPGLLAFGAVVVLTMLAAGSFDPRLIWPEEDSPHSPS
jgi:paraquat-inducible protein A